MTISDWVMILVVIAGPLVAVQLTRYLDNKRESKERKTQLFKTLMGTRSYTVSWDHVAALNRIDLEFDKNDPKEKSVIEAWKAYHDLLNQKNLTAEQWDIKRTDLFVDLLYEMARVLNYDFDKTHIKNSSYSPIAHGTNEEETRQIRQGLIEVLNGTRTIPMRIESIEK